MDASGDQLKGRTFAIDLASDGACSMKEVIKQKLEEFMGYADDDLADYVAVLVCHGKHQDQTKKDLDAFLGDHSGAFVAWLWDHIASNIHHYVPSSQPLQPVETNEQSKNCSEEGTRKSSEKLNRRTIDAETNSKGENEEPVSIATHKEVNERPNKASGTRRRREWTPVHKSSRETKEAPIQETEYEEINDSIEDHKSHSKGKSALKRRHSPEPWKRRGRFRHGESHVDKRTSSTAGLHATCRLLQSAVREAVGPISSTNSKRLESSNKRLRSVVSTNIDNSDAMSDAAEASNRPRALAKSLPTMAVAVKAAAAAAEDVARVKSAGSVFDRLGKRLDNDLNGLHEDVEEHMLDDEGNDIGNTMSAVVYQGHKYPHRSEIHSRLNRGLMDDVSIMDSESIIPSDPIKEGYDEVQEDARHKRLRHASALPRRKQLENREGGGVTRLSTFKDRQPLQAQEQDKRQEESVTVQYRLAQNSQEMARESMVQKTSSETPGASSKILNISVNVNTWKPTHTEPLRDVGVMKTKTSNVNSKLLAEHAEKDIDRTLPNDTGGIELHNEGQIVRATNTNSATNADYSSDIRKGISTSGVCTPARTPEDADSRTVFVSNVHFAATKEALTKHFGRRGEVVKVIILTDAATNQPKGSAYIEFASKEMAEMALTLSETSFMSRMLKVVHKTAASNVEPSVPTRPPLRHPLPFLARRPTRAMYGRGFPGAYRRASYMPRPFGSRSLQWRRDKASGISDNSAGLANESSAATSTAPVNGGNPAGPTSAQLSRPLTYIRDATKIANENAAQAQEQ